MPEDLTDALVNTHCVIEYYGLPYQGPISFGCRIQHEVDYALPLNSGMRVTLVHQGQSHYIEDSEHELVTGHQRLLRNSMWEAVRKKLGHMRTSEVHADY